LGIKLGIKLETVFSLYSFKKTVSNLILFRLENLGEFYLHV
jgi:hypothetical protein